MSRHAESVSAITLITGDMEASEAFYAVLDLEVVFGGAADSFTTFKVNDGQFLNLQIDSSWQPPSRVWGRFILWVDDVDAVHEAFVTAGYSPSMAPADAPWGERYFHIVDPAGHEVSVARRLGA